MLHHVLVLTDDLESSRTFYTEALGFEETETPPQLPFRGVWLAHEGQVCVHLADRETYAAFFATLGLPAGAPVDHVAFRATDLDAASARLEAAGVDAFPNVAPGLLRQLYVTDPNGLRIELNAPLG
jgi:catechol 2,3-dioxygenase-like lactoylglutathione lyase family enzyme